MSKKAAILGGEPVFPQPIPFARPTLPEYSSLEEDLKGIFSSGMLTKGSYLEAYEKEVERFLEVPHALAVSNCTMGIYMLLRALKVKGEVIVPSFSFMATFGAVVNAGLTPVFVDCCRDNFTIDPEAVEKAITDKTGAIIGVSIFGNPPDMEKLSKLAQKYNVRFIMDSAHSFGTLYYGRPMGGHGDGEVFSTSATKLLATGEGGVITTNNEEVYEYLKVFREYGNPGNYDCVMAGMNARLSEFHALIGSRVLPKIEEYALARNRIARAYRENLINIPGIDFQKIRDGCRSSYKDFATVIDEHQFGLSRDTLAEALLSEGIPTRAYFNPPGHTMTAFEKYHRTCTDLKDTEYLSAHCLVLPIYSHMDTDMVEKVVDAVESIYDQRMEIEARPKQLQAT